MCCSQQLLVSDSTVSVPCRQALSKRASSNAASVMVSRCGARFTRNAMSHFPNPARCVVCTRCFSKYRSSYNSQECIALNCAAIRSKSIRAVLSCLWCIRATNSTTSDESKRKVCWQAKSNDTDQYAASRGNYGVPRTIQKQKCSWGSEVITDYSGTEAPFMRCDAMRWRCELRG